jgi:hypothetical protein
MAKMVTWLARTMRWSCFVITIAEEPPAQDAEALELVRSR